MGMPRLRHVPAILFLPAALFAVACARSPAPADASSAAESRGQAQQPGVASADAAPPPAAPGGAMWPGFDEAPASDVAGLQTQLDRAEQALGLALGLTAGGDAPSTAQKAPLPAATATAGVTAAPVAQADPCLVACAALASMKRSADHMCGMAGEAEAVCGGARARVQRAEQRVTQACPSCSAR